MLFLIGVLAGLVAGISPCVLPVLPVVVLSWTVPVDEANPVRARRRRALAVVVGLIVSFSIIQIAGLAVLRFLHLPDDFLRDLGVVLLALCGVALLVPAVAHQLERPFRRLTARPPQGTSSGFVLGLGLGAVFVPCAGPVLVAITTIAASGMETFTSVVLTVCFAIGAAVPLLAIALAGDRVVARSTKLRAHAPRWRSVAGVLLVVLAAASYFNWFSAAQNLLPGYTTALQRLVEGNHYAISHLRQIEHPNPAGASTTTPTKGGAVVHPAFASNALVNCENVAAYAGSSGSLQNCGAAPNFAGIVAWLNTHGTPLTWSSLRGHVVLVDFWTYSCINCQRSLPHVEAWYQRYHADGLVVVGVHSPEFAFEHVVSNVRSAVHQFGLTYPVAVDSNLATWNAYENQYWPAEYLIDAKGDVERVDYGEGNYTSMESAIRQLLHRAHPTVTLPPRTDVPDRTPTAALSPETYLGSDRSQYLDAGSVVQGWHTYAMGAVTSTTYGLSGRWDTTAQFITAGSHARLDLNFTAHDVYLVLGGRGQITVRVGDATRVVHVSGYPRLYQLFSARQLRTATLQLRVTPGVKAYDFTFG